MGSGSSKPPLQVEQLEHEDGEIKNLSSVRDDTPVYKHRQSAYGVRKQSRNEIQRQSQNGVRIQSRNGIQRQSQNGIQRQSQNGIQRQSQNGVRIQPPKGVGKHPSHSRNMTRSSTHMSKEFVPYEAENLKLDGDWEIEKCVDTETPLSEPSYPAPKPGPAIKDRTSFSAVDFEILQNNSPQLAYGEFSGVARMLCDGLESEVLKVRALTTWMSCQRIRTRSYTSEAREGTVAGYMKKIQEGNGTFAALLALLCRSIELPCVIVKGIYKSASHIVGEDDVSALTCTWNAVFVDGNWQLVHPYLICTPLSTKSPSGNWTEIETSREEPPQRNATVLNSFFFAPRPSDFVKLCLPDETCWQLLENIVDHAQFIQYPFLRPAFYDSGLELTSCSKCVVMAQGGVYTIRIQCKRDSVSELKLMYELSSLGDEFKVDKDWGNLVLCGRTEGLWIVQVKFPVGGTFKVSLFALLFDWFFWIGDFQIVCNVPYNNFIPQPTVPETVGLGPCQITEDAGLLCPSHAGGIVFYKPNEHHVIKFLTCDRLFLKFEIENPQYSTEHLHQYGKMVVRRSETDIIINLPIHGEFALRIYNIDDIDDATNVCNYLFVGATDQHMRENVFQRRARARLKETAAGQDVEPLETAVNNFLSTRLPAMDDEYIRATRRLRFLKLKRGLREGRMRRHEDTLRRAVEEVVNSPFRAPLQRNIDQAKDMLHELESLDANTHPVQQLDQKTIAEIANLHNPTRDIHDIMIATYLLLGEDKSYLKTWRNIQGLLRRTGKHGIKHRIKEFKQQPSPKQHTIQMARHLHNNVPKHHLMSASLSAAAFYDWVTTVLAYLANTSQNATDAEKSFETEDHTTIHDKHLVDIENDDLQDEGFHDNDLESHGRSYTHSS